MRSKKKLANASTRHFKKAEHFFNYLRPHNKAWDRGNWVFRGHQEESWELIPSFFRNSDLPHKKYETLYKKLMNRPLADKRTFIVDINLKNKHPDIYHIMMIHNVERILLTEFVKKSNQLGISIPESEYILNSNNSVILDSTQPFEFDPYTSVMIKRLPEYYLSHYTLQNPKVYTALAQHHGIATRLLDFTTHANIAIYFAALARKNPVEKGRIVVTAVNLDYFDENYLFKYVFPTKPHSIETFAPIYSIYRTPNSYNQFSHQQKGLFLFPKYAYDFYRLYNRFPTIEDHVNLYDDYKGEKILQKFSLPHSELDELKWILDRNGITKSVLMPTLDNVAKEVIEDLGELSVRFT